jgi:hypothetical protein
MSICDINRFKFRPFRYIFEIHNNCCPICLENMNIFFNCKRFKGCSQCTFWAHNDCILNCKKCPQCRKLWD